MTPETANLPTLREILSGYNVSELRKLSGALCIRGRSQMKKDALAKSVCKRILESWMLESMLIIQNDTGNRYSPTVIAAAITSQTGKARLPTHIELAAQNYGLTRDSVVLLEQIRTLDKRRLREKMGRVDKELMDRVDAAIAVSFGLHNDRLV